jgi:hypothetical protein
MGGKLLYPQEKNPGSHWLDEPQSQSGCCGEEKNSALPGIKPQLSNP